MIASSLSAANNVLVFNPVVSHMILIRVAAFSNGQRIEQHIQWVDGETRLRNPFL
jgi:hypothetical protein